MPLPGNRISGVTGGLSECSALTLQGEDKTDLQGGFRERVGVNSSPLSVHREAECQASSSPLLPHSARGLAEGASPRRERLQSPSSPCQSPMVPSVTR